MFRWFKRRREPQSERSTVGASAELFTTPIAEVREKYEADALERQDAALREAERKIAEERWFIERRRQREERFRSAGVPDPLPIHTSQPSKSYSSGGHHHREDTPVHVSDPTPTSDGGDSGD